MIPQNFIESKLEPGEAVLWSGQPRQGYRITFYDVVVTAIILIVSIGFSIGIFGIAFNGNPLALLAFPIVLFVDFECDERDRGFIYSHDIVLKYSRKYSWSVESLQGFTFHDYHELPQFEIPSGFNDFLPIFIDAQNAHNERLKSERIIQNTF